MPLTQVNTKIVVKFTKETDSFQRIEILSNYPSLEIANVVTAAIPYVELKVNGEVTDISGMLSALNSLPQVASANFTYLANNVNLGITNEFIVKLKSIDDYSKLVTKAQEEHVNIVRTLYGTNNIYILSVNKGYKSAIDEANYFFESGDYDFAEPNFLIKLKFSTNDTYFGDQYALKNTGQYGGISYKDIEAEDAWSITMGRPEVIVAVLDMGIQLSHPDLQGQFVTGADAYTGIVGSGGSITGGTYGDIASTGEHHGTKVAGLICAKANNNFAIAGVAPNCKIMPIRIEDQYGNFVSYSNTAEAFYFAQNNGASVVNCSWGTGSTTSLSSTLDQAINDLINGNTSLGTPCTVGRGSLGIPIVFSSGNEDYNYIEWPKNNTGVIVAGASTMCDERKSPSSCDGDVTWGSNYGPELSVMAAGAHLVTTDIYYTGASGVAQFDGTSGAAPIVSGVLALIFSVNRCLSKIEAEKILDLSCDKMGLYSYCPLDDVLSKNIETGYGRVNAYKAVQFAFSNFNTPTLSASVISTTSAFSWAYFQTSACTLPVSIANATYYVNQRCKLNITLSYPPTPYPYFWGHFNTISAANPNSGQYWDNITSYTNTSATFESYIYQLTDALGNTFWFPTDISGVQFSGFVGSNYPGLHECFFQNQTNTSSSEEDYCETDIYSGYNVDGSNPSGNYTISNTANVTWKAKKSINLEPGFSVASGGYFDAKVGTDAFPNLKCSQFPNGMVKYEGHTNNDWTNLNLLPDLQRPAINNNLFTSAEGTNAIKVCYSIACFPNPFTDKISFKYTLPEPTHVTLIIYDLMGRQVAILNDHVKLLSGIYTVDFGSLNLSAGTYYYKFQTDTYKATGQIIKINAQE